LNHVGDQLWSQTLSRRFKAAKRERLWRQNGGLAGIELDDIKALPPTPLRG
jgi:hypothetical protein